MRQLKKILISILIIAILVVALLSMRIQHIEVVNNIKLSDMQIVSTIFDKEIEKNALVLFINDKLGRHKTIDYVSEYTIKWLSPFSVVIEVHEKPSIAFVRRNLKNVYFDRDGVINDVTDDKKDNIIEVSGIEFKNYEKGSKIASKDMKAINAILNISNSLYDSGIPAEYLEITKEGDLTVYIGDVTVVLGDTKNMEIKLQRLIDIYKEISDLKGTLYLANARENMLDEQYIFKKVD